MQVIDQNYSCQISSLMLGSQQLQCRLRIFQPAPEVQTILLSEVSSAIRWSIPYLLEQIINQIMREFQLEPDRSIWIEQSSMAEDQPICSAFNHITFEWCDGRATYPHCMAITPQMVQMLSCGTSASIEKVRENYNYATAPRYENC